MLARVSVSSSKATIGPESSGGRAGKLTGNSFAVLAIVQRLDGAAPYDIERAVESWLGSFWSLAHTTAYQEADRLFKLGYLRLDRVEGNRRRKVFAITETGRSALQSWGQSPDAEPPVLRHEALLKLAFSSEVGGMVEPVSLLASARTWHQERLARLNAVKLSQDGGPEELGMNLAIAYEDALLSVLGSPS